jgi:hypothetical protein
MNKLNFLEIPQLETTTDRIHKVFLVQSVDTQYSLGSIAWQARYHQYGFSAVHNMPLRVKHVMEIYEFLQSLMFEHREGPEEPNETWNPTIGDHVMAAPPPTANPTEAVITFIYPPMMGSKYVTCRVMDPHSKVEWDCTMLSISPIKK